MKKPDSHVQDGGGFQVKALRTVAIILALMLAIVSVVALTGCKPSVEGEWGLYIDDSFATMKIDKDWVYISAKGVAARSNDGEATDLGERQYRYTLNGDSVMQLSRNNETYDIQYVLKGDTLTLSNSREVNGTFVRTGTSGYKAALQQWEKAQTDMKKEVMADYKADVCSKMRDAVEVAFGNAIEAKYPEAASGYGWRGYVRDHLSDPTFKTMGYNEALVMARPELSGQTFNPDDQSMYGVKDNPEEMAIWKTAFADFKCPDGGTLTWNSADFFSDDITCSKHDKQ